jgi:hypothetical protein
LAEPSRLLLAEVDGVLLGVGYLRGDLHGEVGLVLAGPEGVGQFVEDLGQLGGVVLADGEDDGLAEFAADRVAQAFFRKVWQNRRLVASEKNFFSKSRWKKLSCSVVAFARRHHDCVARRKAVAW